MATSSDGQAEATPSQPRSFLISEKSSVQEDSVVHTNFFQDKAPPGSATMISCVMNQANTIVGYHDIRLGCPPLCLPPPDRLLVREPFRAGMLSFPSAYASSGYGLGSLLLLLFAGASVISQVMLGRLARQFGRPSSFRKTCTLSGLPGLAPFVDMSVVLVCMGAGDHTDRFGNRLSILFLPPPPSLIRCCTSLVALPRDGLSDDR